MILSLKTVKSAYPKTVQDFRRQFASKESFNLKTWLTGTHYEVQSKHFANYLDEYVFSLNRRQIPMAAFQTLLSRASNKKHMSIAQQDRSSQVPKHYLSFFMQTFLTL